MSKKAYEVIVIGGGAAGSSVAKALAKNGKRVALVERDRLGGTCLNYGCDPTKALLHAAHTHYNMRRSARFGLRAENIHFDWHAVQQRVSGLINNIRGGSHEDALDKQRQRGVDVYLDCATFTSPHEVHVGAAVLEGAQIVLAMGYTARIPGIRGLRETGFITNREAIWLNSLPRRLGIIGGGPQGVEFAQLFSRFGVKVTLFQKGPRILPKDDAELAGNLADYLRMEGIQLHCDAEVTRVEASEDGKRIHWEHKDEAKTLEVDEILLAAGRVPEIDALHLDAAGVEYTEKGVAVDDEMRTNVPHIWAAGDVTGMYPFTHVASRQAAVLVHNLLSSPPRKMDYHAIPWATYTEPALAHVGKTMQQLDEEGTPYEIHKVAINDVIRSRLNGETEGKITLYGGKDRQILGCHILAPRGAELIAPVVVAMRNRLTLDQLADTILPYPTMSEGLIWAAK